MIKPKTDYIKCIDCVDGMGQLPDNSIDMIMTSPPYDKLRTYDGFCFDFDSTANQIVRVLKDGGVCVWVVADQVVNGCESLTSFKQAIGFVEKGLRLHDTMIWMKDTFTYPDKTRYRSCFEYMFVLSKGAPKTFNPIRDRPNKYAGTHVHGTMTKTDGSRVHRNYNTEIGENGVRFNVWQIPGEKTNHTNHPAPYPLKLAEDNIKSWTNEGDIVLDPFIGSGTTALACKNLGRHYIGYDISDEYCKIAQDRLSDNKI